MPAGRPTKPKTINGIVMQPKKMPLRGTGLLICTNDRIKAQAGAVWFDGHCVRCAPILKKIMMCYGKETQLHQINFNWFKRLGWEGKFYPADIKG